MRILHCATDPPTTVRIGDCGEPIAADLAPPAFGVVDARVRALHPELLPAHARVLAVDGGEELKTFAGLEHLLRSMAQAGLDRTARVVAIGGGTVGDAAGLAAALYLRGVELVQVPTTLLAMLDSSIGGKTAINLPEGKNLVGQFWPAARVHVDPRFLGTLPRAEIDAGLGEALKIAIGLDRELFALLEARPGDVRGRAPGVLDEVIERAIAAKIAVVAGDARERGGRRVLNLGHTLGHALEAHARGALPHGLAVARGLLFALRIAERRELLARADAERCRALLAAYGHDEWPLPSAAELAPFLARDKKTEGGDVHMVLPGAIGACRTVRMPLREVLDYLSGGR